MTDREKLIKELTELYNKNLHDIENFSDEKFTKKYKKETIVEFKRLNKQLKDYIEDIKKGLDCDKSLQDWCNLFFETLLYDGHLDDDNFPFGGNW